MTGSLLPPNAQPGDRTLEAVTARIGDIAEGLPAIWNPASCPVNLLPWLAWGLSIDIWDQDWSEGVKRELIADAIARQRRKGSVGAVREVLDAFDANLSLHEWFAQATPQAPYTFEIRLPVEPGTGSAALIERVADQVVRVKPARAHFTVAQTLRAQAEVGVLAVARAAVTRRINFGQAGPIDWTGCLLTEHGEPLFTEAEQRLEPG